MPAVTVTVTNDPVRRRYEARVDGALAGFAEYVPDGDVVVFTHTVVDPAFEGRGIGSAIARFALDDVRRDAARSVVPLCPFIEAWIRRHPDYADLIAGSASPHPVDPGADHRSD